MIQTKVLIAGLVIASAISFLVYTAVKESSKKVVTVASLLTETSPKKNIRLGARVADRDIDYSTNPSFLLRFTVRDITIDDKQIPVRYEGIMPDTLKVGRDVILEGEYDGREFHAKSLMTQCPSKYEPPVPGKVKG